MDRLPSLALVLLRPPRATCLRQWLFAISKAPPLGVEGSKNIQKIPHNLVYNQREVQRTTHCKKTTQENYKAGHESVYVIV